MQTNPARGGMQGPEWLSSPPPAASPDGVMRTVEQHETELFSPYCTLNEPVRETILRDVTAVASKLKIVMLPMPPSAYAIPFRYSVVASRSHHDDDEEEENGVGPTPGIATPTPPPPPASDLSEQDRKVIQSLKDWDLWGPLVLCLFLAVLLSLKAPTNQSSLVFAAVFCSICAGGSVITVNAQLLGGSISFFQSLCVIGYSMFPLVIAAFCIGVFKIFLNTWWWFDLIFIVIGYLWSVRVTSIFLGLYIKPERRFLALYPVFFFYTFMGWLILVF